jgi:hypothetical protein
MKKYQFPGTIKCHSSYTQTSISDRATLWWQGTQLTWTNKGGNKCSKMSRIHFKNLGAKKLTRNKFHTSWDSTIIQRLRTKFRLHEDLAPMICAPIVNLNIFPFSSDRFPCYSKTFRKHQLAAHVSKEINQYETSRIYTRWSKSLYAPNDYSIKITQTYFKQY